MIVVAKVKAKSGFGFIKTGIYNIFIQSRPIVDQSIINEI